MLRIFQASVAGGLLRDNRINSITSQRPRHASRRRSSRRLRLTRDMLALSSLATLCARNGIYAKAFQMLKNVKILSYCHDNQSLARYLYYILRVTCCHALNFLLIAMLKNLTMSEIGALTTLLKYAIEDATPYPHDTSQRVITVKLNFHHKEFASLRTAHAALKSEYSRRYNIIKGGKNE